MQYVCINLQVIFYTNFYSKYNIKKYIILDVFYTDLFLLLQLINKKQNVNMWIWRL